MATNRTARYLQWGLLAWFLIVAALTVVQRVLFLPTGGSGGSIWGLFASDLLLAAPMMPWFFWPKRGTRSRAVLTDLGVVAAAGGRPDRAPSLG